MQKRLLPNLFLALLLVVGSHAMANVVYVKNAAEGNADGSSWTNAMGDIQSAIDKAATMNPKGDVYVAGYNDNGATVYLLENTIELADGVSIYGGFPSDNSVNDPALRPKADKNLNGIVEAWEYECTTILDGDDKVRCFVQLTEFAQEVVVNGFNITKGRAAGESNEERCGGGIKLLKNGKLINSIVTNCYASSRGGGVHLNAASLEASCVKNNETLYDGGGVAKEGAYIGDVINCLIESNKCLSSTGGGIYGGNVINCTIVNNISRGNGAGSAGSTLTNCIVWGNQKMDGTSNQIVEGYVLVNNCAIEGDKAPTWSIPPYHTQKCKNNIALAADNSERNGPGFVDPENDNWSLKQGSYCINRGTNASAAEKDIACNDRIYNKEIGGIADIGCYESFYNGNIMFELVSSYNYTGEAIQVSLLNMNPWTVTPSYMFRKKGTDEFSSQIPVEPGVYEVKTTTDDSNWECPDIIDIEIKVITPIIIWEQELNPGLLNSTVELTARSNTGLPVVYSIEKGSAELSGNEITFNTAGEIIIKAKQEATDDYAVAEKTMTVFVTGPLVNIPDANFKQALLNNTEINNDGNPDEISVAEAEAVTGTLELKYENIKDLTGIETFVNLTGLDCSGNDLTMLDVSNNTALEVLLCAGNELSSLDVSKNTALVTLDCSNNNFSGGDGYPMEEIMPGIADLSGDDEDKEVTIDVTQNTLLEKLNCGRNGITNIDLSQNTELEQLILGDQREFAESLDFPGGGEPKAQLKATLKPIIPGGLQRIDLSQNKKLKLLSLIISDLVELDLSNNTELLILACSGYNASAYEYTSELKSEEVKPEGLTSIDLSMNTKLMGLMLEECPFTQLDLSKNTQLMALGLSEMPLESLDLSNNPQLMTLECWDTPIESLDLSNNTALQMLDAEGNALKQIDLTNNTELVKVGLQSNDLESINVNSLTKLKELSISDNQIKELRIHNPDVKIETIRCRDNLISDIYFYSEETCNELYCDDNPLPFSELITIKAQNLHCNTTKKVFDETNEVVGYVVDYHDEVSPGPNNTVFAWYNSEENPVDEISVKEVEGQSGHFKFLKAGTYYCKMTNLHFDTDVTTNNITISVATDLRDNVAKQINFQVYPNPALGAFTIDLGQAPVEAMEVTIYDMSGQLIDRQTYQQAKVKYTKSLASGVYFVVIMHNGKKYTQKLIVK